MSHFTGPELIEAYPRFRPATSVFRLLVEALQNNGEDLALVEGQTGKTASFAEILQQSTSLAAGLQQRGVAAGDYVVLCCDMSILSCSLLLAVMFTGATAVVCPTGNADIIHSLTKDYIVKAIFFDSVYSNPVSGSLREMCPPPCLVSTISPEDPVMATLLKTPSGFSVVDVENVYRHVPMVLFSSGTTGDPKGIQLTDVSLQLMCFVFNPQVKSLMNASPIYWFSGIFAFLSSVLNKYTFILSNCTVAEENLEIVHKFQPEGWFLSIGAMIKYVNCENMQRYNLSSVKCVFTGGETVLPSVAELFITKVLRAPVTLEIIYGNTEAGLVTKLVVTERFREMELGSCGRAYPGVEIKIVGDDGNVVPPGNMGDLCVKSPGLTPGYWGRPELNRTLLDKEGFFKSGDSAFVDAAGNLSLRGRKGDLINYRGFMFTPSEAENLLMAHPAVQDAAVVGRPHPTDIQHATAFVVRKPGADVTQQDIADFVDSRVDVRKRLRGGVHFTQSLPRVAVGKVTRKALLTADI